MAQISTSVKRTTEVVVFEAAARTPTAALLVLVTLDTLMTEPLA